jgi:hypothetical protein
LDNATGLLLLLLLLLLRWRWWWWRLLSTIRSATSEAITIRWQSSPSSVLMWSGRLLLG